MFVWLFKCFLVFLWWMLHFVWWFCFWISRIWLGYSKMDVDGCDFMGAVRCCLLLKKLRMSRNDRVPMLPVALVAVNHVSFPWKKPSKTIQHMQFCRIGCNMQIHRTFPFWVLGFAHGFPPENPTFLLWRPATKSSCPAGEAGGFVCPMQWFSLWRRQAG